MSGSSILMCVCVRYKYPRIHLAHTLLLVFGDAYADSSGAVRRAVSPRSQMKSAMLGQRSAQESAKRWLASISATIGLLYNGIGDEGRRRSRTSEVESDEEGSEEE